MTSGQQREIKWKTEQKNGEKTDKGTATYPRRGSARLHRGHSANYFRFSLVIFPFWLLWANTLSPHVAFRAVTGPLVMRASPPTGWPRGGPRARAPEAGAAARGWAEGTRSCWQEAAVALRTRAIGRARQGSSDGRWLKVVPF